MAIQLTADDAKQSLNAHVAAKGAELFAKFGPVIGWSQLQAILQDRTCVRYPCRLVFDSSGLNPGEFAHPEPDGDRPEDGFTLYVHPIYLTQLAMVPYLALYQLVVVNYGVFASAQDAETFAAHALGRSQEEYYETLCGLADLLGPAPVATPMHGGCCSESDPCPSQN
jgi:hypothetical protein